MEKAGWYRRAKTEVPEENLSLTITNSTLSCLELNLDLRGHRPPELRPGLEVQRSQMYSRECEVTKGRKHNLYQGFQTAARDHICKLYV
jgi:hypothetical protein